MSLKNKVLDIFMEWRKRMELRRCRKIKILRSDNGAEYKCDLSLQLCYDESIERRFTIRETSQQNEVVKRLNNNLLKNI